MILRVKDTADLISFECIGLQHLSTPYSIAIPKGKYVKCNRKELEKVIKNRMAGMGIAINGGNIIIAGKDPDSSYKPLELE